MTGTGPDDSLPRRKRLRVGLLVSGRRIETWQRECVRQLLAGDDGGVELIIEVGSSGRTARRDRPLERLIGRPASLAMVEWPEEWRMIPIVPVADVDAVRRSDLDVLLRLTSTSAEGELRTAIRHGVWTYRHGGWREVMTGRAVTAAVLERSDGTAIRRGYFATIRHSYAANADRARFGSAGWVASACRAIRTLGEAPAAERVTEQTPFEAPDDPRADHPTVAQCLRLLATLARGRLVRLARRLRVDDWNVGWIDMPVDQVLRHPAPLPVTWLPTRRGRYAADPFGIERDGRLEVLFEDFDHAKSSAVISRVTVGPDGVPTPPATVLAPGRHSSYPYLIEDGGEIYMLPETSSERKLVLYRALDFPISWDPVGAILEGVQVSDATAFSSGNRWWLLAVRSRVGWGSTELLCWHSTSIRGPWHEHPANPVKVDARSARPAGPPFTADGQLYRPAQDCSIGYGRRIVINRIDELSTAAFHETTVRVLEAGEWGAFRNGFHTFSGAGGRTLVDARRRIFFRSARQPHQ